jgi:hypothetical protein
LGFSPQNCNGLKPQKFTMPSFSHKLKLMAIHSPKNKSLKNNLPLAFEFIQKDFGIKND